MHKAERGREKETCSLAALQKRHVEEKESLPFLSDRRSSKEGRRIVEFSQATSKNVADGVKSVNESLSRLL